jgi:hypothetical protein
MRTQLSKELAKTSDAMTDILMKKMEDKKVNSAVMAQAVDRMPLMQRVYEKLPYLVGMSLFGFIMLGMIFAAIPAALVYAR